MAVDNYTKEFEVDVARRVIAARVEALHHRFDHMIEFRESENIAIITAPNGYGKTAFLELLAGALQLDMKPILAHNFTSFHIKFSDGHELSVRKHPKQGRSKRDLLGEDVEDDSTVVFQLSEFGRGLHTARMQKSEVGNVFSGSSVERVLPFVRKIDVDTYFDARTGEHLDRRQVRRLMSEYLLEPAKNSRVQFEEIRKFLARSKCVLIGAQRTIVLRPKMAHRSANEYEMGIEERAQSLAAKILEGVTRYAALSQELDSTFPFRVVERANMAERTSPASLTMERLREIEDRRRAFIEAGLVSRSSQGLSLFEGQLHDNTIRSVLSVYIEDANQKLDEVQEIKEKVDLFLTSLNRKFSFKSIKISNGTVRIASKEGDSLSIRDLSSGEQHQFILLYDMIFETSENMLVIIDEPEISLHVSWQKSFLSDLEAISKLTGYQALVATHSPQIIGGRWDVVEEFGPVED